MKSDINIGMEYFSALNAFAYILDLDTLKICWNSGTLEKIIGFDPVAENLEPMEFAEKYYHPEDQKLMMDRIRNFRLEKVKCWSGIYRIRHFDGHWVWVYSKINTIESLFNEKKNRLAGLITEANNGLQTEDQLNILIREASRLRNSKKLQSLTPREISVIKLIARGNSYTNIAAQLHIQPDTVNKHRKNILRKLHCKNIATLICFAKETGIV